MLTILILRFVIGLGYLASFSRNEQIKVTGNVVKVIQKDNKCIIELGLFIADLPESCKIKKGEQIVIVGRPKHHLIEALKGKIVLEIALFEKLEKERDLVIGQEQKISFFEAIKNYCAQIYQSFLPARESALLAGIVLGDKDHIGYDFYQKMVKSGTIHIAVASGYNLLLVGGTVLAVSFWIFSRKRATVVAIVVMTFYAILAGFEPPVVRALLMASLVYICTVQGRKADTGWFLFLSAWAMVVWDFGLLWSVSFQLSVMASVGLVVFAPWIQRRLAEKGLEREGVWLERFGIITTSCTMLATAPIIWWHFGRISLIGVFSNVFILPLVPPVMILGVFTLVLPAIFAYPTYALVHLMVLIINFFGS